MNSVDLEKSRVTNDADEMISLINGLTVSGGDDCPEYSLSGLITGTCNLIYKIIPLLIFSEVLK